jgi:hypothetical protein
LNVVGQSIRKSSDAQLRVDRESMVVDHSLSGICSCRLWFLVLVFGFAWFSGVKTILHSIPHSWENCSTGRNEASFNEHIHKYFPKDAINDFMKVRGLFKADPLITSGLSAQTTSMAQTHLSFSSRQGGSCVCPACLTSHPSSIASKIEPKSRFVVFELSRVRSLLQYRRHAGQFASACLRNRLHLRKVYCSLRLYSTLLGMTVTDEHIVFRTWLLGSQFKLIY